MNYYNEFDPKAAAWLRQLIADRLIPPGDVDTRSIADVQPGDLSTYTQCHFFAGIGGWSYALQLAGWPEDRPVWTGSCPCQPFSSAGKQLGTSDERHLWPQFFRLISECKPPIVFGEQVASKAGRGWLAGVRADLERVGYGVAAADLCAAGVGAPHIRQRLYWVADSSGERCYGFDPLLRAKTYRRVGEETLPETAGSGIADGLEHPGHLCGRGRPESGEPAQLEVTEPSPTGGLEITASTGLEGHGIGRGTEPCCDSTQRSDDVAPSGGRIGRLEHSDGSEGERFGRERLSLEPEQEARRCGDATDWSRYEIVGCGDGKARRFEPGSFPLADGVPGRVGLLRGYGNAIVPQVAAQFIQASEEALNYERLGI